jgi:hypothetical protein
MILYLLLIKFASARESAEHTPNIILQIDGKLNTISEYVYCVKHIITGKMYTIVDLTRLKCYHDASLDQNRDLWMHVRDEGLFYEINEVKDFDLRLNAETTSWRILLS